MCYNTQVTNQYRGVAQFGRAPRSGRGGRKFESCHLDQKTLESKCFLRPYFLPKFGLNTAFYGILNFNRSLYKII